MRLFAILLILAGCGDDVMTTDGNAGVGGGSGGSGGQGGSSGSGGQGGSVDAAGSTIDAAVPDAAPNLPTCPCWLGDGTYCATAVTIHGNANNCMVAALAGHEGDVFHCAGGTWTVQTACSNGCYIAPDGTAD